MASRVKRRFVLPLPAAALIAAAQLLLGVEDSRPYRQTRELTLLRGEDGFCEVPDALASLRCRVSLRGLPEGSVCGISESYTILLSDGTALTICDTGTVRQNGRIYAVCPAGRERLPAALFPLSANTRAASLASCF